MVAYARTPAKCTVSICCPPCPRGDSRCRMGSLDSSVRRLSPGLSRSTDNTAVDTGLDWMVTGAVPLWPVWPV
ncbi:hypothetical protein D3C71_1530250 [compost metagenome]